MKIMVQSTNLSIPSDKLDQGRELSLILASWILLEKYCKMENSRHNLLNK